MVDQVVCRACGTVAAGDDRFCNACGTPLSEPAGVTSAAPPGSPSGPSPSASQQTQDAGSTQQWGAQTPDGPPHANGGGPADINLSSIAEVQRRFKSLRLVASILTVLAWVVVVVGSIAVLISATRVHGVLSLGVLIVGGIGVALDALFLFAAAAGIRLMIGIEENTRATAENTRVTAENTHATAETLVRQELVART